LALPAFNRLSKAYCFIEGLTLLSKMRRCANVPAWQAIQSALGAHQPINDVTLPVGRLRPGVGGGWSLRCRVWRP
jgi:alanine-synthesizing transaminase